MKEFYVASVVTPPLSEKQMEGDVKQKICSTLTEAKDHVTGLMKELSDEFHDFSWSDNDGVLNYSSVQARAKDIYHYGQVNGVSAGDTITLSDL